MSQDYAQWFDPLGTCKCGKAASGEVRSFYGNSVVARTCRPCGEKMIKAAHRKHKAFEPDLVIDERATQTAFWPTAKAMSI